MCGKLIHFFGSNNKENVYVQNLEHILKTNDQMSTEKRGNQ